MAYREIVSIICFVRVNKIQTRIQSTDCTEKCMNHSLSKLNQCYNILSCDSSSCVWTCLLSALSRLVFSSYFADANKVYFLDGGICPAWQAQLIKQLSFMCPAHLQHLPQLVLACLPAHLHSTFLCILVSLLKAYLFVIFCCYLLFLTCPFSASGSACSSWALAVQTSQ